MGIIDGALYYASVKHDGQFRKYTGEPYINHCCEVVEILKSHDVTDENMLIAAYLHDTVEDTDTTYQDIYERFGMTVMKYVFFLTDQTRKEQGNRKVRKSLDMLHVVGSPYPETLIIKCADLISNTKSIVERDPGFAQIYLEEKRELLKSMKDAPAGKDLPNNPIYREACRIAGLEI